MAALFRLKNMQRILFLLFIGILLGACSANKEAKSLFVHNDSLQIIRIDTTQFITASDIITDINFVRLESSAQNFIGRIDQILFVDERIIVLDRFKAQGVFVFDKTGKFLHRIGQLGKGPNEYTSIDHIAIIPDKTQLAILDRNARNVKFFNLNGQYIKTEPVPVYISSIEYLSKDLQIGATDGRRSVGTGFDGYSLLQFDKKWNIIGYGFKDPFPRELTYTSLNSLKKNNNQVYYTPPFEDKIYKIHSADSTELAYQIDYNGLGIPDREKYAAKSVSQFEQLLRNYLSFDGYYCDLKDWLLLNISHRGLQQTYFYNKQLDSTYRLSRKITSPLQNFFSNADFCYSDNSVVSVVHALDLVQISPWIRGFAKAIPQEPRTYELIDELLSGLTENDNPVLFFFTLKKPDAKDN